MRKRGKGTSNAEFGAVQSNTFEGIKEQLMREIEPKIKRLIETSASQQMLNLQSELNAFAHNPTMDKHGETYVHHSKKPSDVVPTAPEIRDQSSSVEGRSRDEIKVVSRSASTNAITEQQR